MSKSILCSVFVFALFLTSSLFADEGSFGIEKGQKAPQIQMSDIDGKNFDLKKSLTEGEVVLVFYRGGWCPYCNLQLRNLQAQALPGVNKKNAKMVVISVDRADEALKTKKKEKLGMLVLSDPKAEVLRKYNVAYKVPKELVEKYKNSYKIDLEKSSGQKHHVIAVPAVFVVNQKGMIKFSYVNEDYKVRAQVKDILAALK